MALSASDSDTSSSLPSDDELSCSELSPSEDEAVDVNTTEQYEFDQLFDASVKEIEIEGSATRTLIGASLIGCVAVATAVLLSSTRNHLKGRMPLLEDGVASSALVTAPNLAGSLTRLPASIALERFSSKSIHAFIMSLSLVGTVCLMILSFATANMETLNSGVFAGYMIFGLIGGLGVGLFSPGIATVSFWHPKSKQGNRNGLFGGVTNLAPGLFGLWIECCMPIHSCFCSRGIATVSFWHPKSKQGSHNGLFGGVTNLAPGLFGLWGVAQLEQLTALFISLELYAMRGDIITLKLAPDDASVP